MRETVQILAPGLLSTLQDFGRFGQLARGITRGGPVDERAFLWANRLLDNDPNAAQIEVTMGGLQLRILQPCQLVVSGADAPLTVDGEAQPLWHVLTLKAGQTLQLGSPRHGLRNYVAICGGFAAPTVDGSCATVRRDKRGGLHGDGQPLAAGDQLHARQQQLAHPARRPPLPWLQKYQQPAQYLQLALIASGQAEQFSAEARQQLVSQRYRVTPAMDRMGVRLQGTEAIPWPHVQLISEPLPVGAVQIPADGQPIVMLNDRQTLGGYPKIATLSWSARCALAQAAPGSELQFVWQSLAEAQAEWQQVARFFGLSRCG